MNTLCSRYHYLPASKPNACFFSSSSSKCLFILQHFLLLWILPLQKQIKVFSLSASITFCIKLTPNFPCFYQSQLLMFHLWVLNSLFVLPTSSITPDTKWVTNTCLKDGVNEWMDESMKHLMIFKKLLIYLLGISFCWVLEFSLRSKVTSRVFVYLEKLVMIFSLLSYECHGPFSGKTLLGLKQLRCTPSL